MGPTTDEEQGRRTAVGRRTVADRRPSPCGGAPGRGVARRRTRLPAAVLLLVIAASIVAAGCGGDPGSEPGAAGTGGTATPSPTAAGAGGAGPAASPTAAPPATSEATLMRERVLLLQGYIETYALQHYYEYPGAGKVRRGGALPAALWPEDPWTGKPLRPGTAPGTYTYTVAADRRSYRLVGHLPGGDVEVRGAMPHTGEVAYRHREQEGLTLIRQFVIEWARRHDGIYPPASEVSREGGVGALRDGGFWPSNPWNHGPMIQSDAVGDFAYEVAADGSRCRLTLHTSPRSDWTLECGPLEGTPNASGD